jgi:hypothetical protein
LKLQRILKKAKKKQSTKLTMFWDLKDENLITLYTDDNEDGISKLTINAYSKKLSKTIEKVATCMELFKKDSVTKPFILNNIDRLKGKYLHIIYRNCKNKTRPD